MTEHSQAPPVFRENIYGHLQRVNWIAEQLQKSDRVVEFGCGTGYLITYPLLLKGYDVIGVDLDERSIEAGRRILADGGLSADRLSTTDLGNVPGDFDAVIVSEVLEHLTDMDVTEVLSLLHHKLRPGGRLVVTVPNGYGWYELECLLWDRFGLRRLYERVRTTAPVAALRRAKRRVAKDAEDIAHPMTLGPSPHLQRFTWASLRRTLEQAGFAIHRARGAVVFCGPISDLLLSGFPRVMTFNKTLGEHFPRVAADFYVVATRR